MISLSVLVQRDCTVIAPGIYYYYDIIIVQAHNDLIKTYEAKLSVFGVPTEELGFKPLKSTVAGQTLGQGPAGLVASPSY